MRRSIRRADPGLISHDFGPVTPITRGVAVHRPVLELVLGGCTFDLFIMAVPQRHLQGQYFNAQDAVEAGFVNSSCAVVVMPGPHLIGSEGMLPVVRAQWALGARLAGILPDLAGTGWGPSATVRPADAFIAAVDAWARGGPIPSPGLITFQPVLSNALQSAGLAHFTGQELRLEPELAGSGDYGQRLGQQIAHMLIHRGTLTSTEQFTGPAGEALRLEPSVNSRFVRVWAG